ncbi:biotin/acetyl-CoA-carboxylase ligase [Gemmatirosa kalamazoonensis]|uniref:Biotin/acetyl-CoA-carboxylase ligase n=1 Tax=Gemmatirosa kalamazoonensis TaxID=861299 RepID=W0RIV6_9BACT|nr:biotin--[acetyl-CoA-carboxylase] ligase [Gemmatirosa kalamazoonensis]AHG90696.1 biotin/acetyl-CoA-carboxylase ligase [Gemmatirosa kalamazoonensis]
MSSSADVVAPSYDGESADALARSLDVPRLLLFSDVSSTMDVAHAAAARGAPAGTLVLADAQSAGRGRAGRRWASRAGGGIWLTLVERPDDASAIEVLSLRLGLAAAAAVEPFADGRVCLKWPNDLYVAAGKLAGLLVEARWRDGRPEWVAIGFGMNVRPPEDVPGAGHLRGGTRRPSVLRALVPALRQAAARRGPLDSAELEAFANRDVAVGRTVSAPLAGRVVGISAAGELRVETAAGRVEAVRHGSLVLADGSSFSGCDAPSPRRVTPA